MNQVVDTAIVLGRTDFGEADRILTLLTPSHGKLRLMAKGVRRVKSKLAGGIELFSISSITFVLGRGDIGTLVSTRLVKHYGEIVRDLGRTQAAYDFIKQLNKLTEDEPGAEYYHLLEHIFESLNDAGVDLALVRCWFGGQLLKLGGHTPNLQTDADGSALSAQTWYAFDFSQMCFAPNEQGSFGANHIKLLRLIFTNTKPAALQRISGVAELAQALAPLIQTLRQEAGY